MAPALADLAICVKQRVSTRASKTGAMKQRLILPRSPVGGIRRLLRILAFRWVKRVGLWRWTWIPGITVTRALLPSKRNMASSQLRSRLRPAAAESTMCSSTRKSWRSKMRSASVTASTSARKAALSWQRPACTRAGIVTLGTKVSLPSSVRRRICRAGW